MHKRNIILFIILITFVSACSPAWGSDVRLPAPTETAALPSTVFNIKPTFTPFQPEGSGISPTPTPSPSPALSPTVTPTSSPQTLWIAPGVPDSLRQIAQVSGLLPASDAASASVRLDVSAPSGTSSTWIYALVAPFPTTIDGVSSADIRLAWSGGTGGPFGGKPLRMDQTTLAAFTSVWGPPAPDAVFVAATDRLLDLTWTERPIWAIVPFEALEPRWKVLIVDGQSPVHNDFNPAGYPLKISFAVQPANFQIPATNRDPAKLTVLVMTGTTALVRGTADRMETKGLLYPGQLIRDVLRSADLTHISNEVSFDPNCPIPSLFSESLRFCSDPRYIALLEDVGVKIVELTGNHLLDYSQSDLLATLDMYSQRGWSYYGGGRNLADSQKILSIINHGNKLAFIGCNFNGPSSDWATDTSPGSAPCDFPKMQAEIASLKSAGFLPIVTFQYNEYYMATPTSTEQRDFQGMASAGAVIVSGSQAHVPQIMEFYSGSFVHFGLGNLFFDQMSVIMPNGQRTTDTRREFVDRHVFYDGKYISVELLTYMLDDYAQPRPMTPAERTQFLNDIFSAAGW